MDRNQILVAVENYPGGGSGVSHHFVHVRNKYYVEHGLSVVVLSFKAAYDYEYEGVRVISYQSFLRMRDEFSCLVIHQANMKHHAKLLLRYGKLFPHFVFFFHGHEVLRVNSVYPKPYSFSKSSNLLHRCFQDLYDSIKLKYWHFYYPAVAGKSDYIFVSKWMRDQFEKWLNIDIKESELKSHIIPNCIAGCFEHKSYNMNCKKHFDFVTIRGNLDTSKYAVDLVVKSAEANPDFKYLIVGKGKLFDYIKCPSNITWLNKTSTHDEIIEYLNASRCALMPTRTDAQGLMMCEMASFGIPTITSDLPVCREVLAGFSNVDFISNNEFDRSLRDKLERLSPLNSKNESFFSDNTIGKEVMLIQSRLRK